MLKRIVTRARPLIAALFCLAALTLAGCTAEGGGRKDERVSLFNDRLSFAPPAGMRQLTAEEIAARSDGPERPHYVFAGESTEIILRVLEDTPMRPEELADIKRFVEGTHRDYSGWLTSEMIKINGRDWFHFEWVTPERSELEDLIIPAPAEGDATTKPTATPDARAFRYNEYTTHFGGKPLQINFKALAGNHETLRAAFAQSIASVHIKD